MPDQDARIQALEAEKVELAKQVDALKRALEHGAFDERTLRHYGNQAFSNAEVKLLQIEVMAADTMRSQLTALRQQIEALRPKVGTVVMTLMSLPPFPWQADTLRELQQIDALLIALRAPEPNG